MGFGDLKNSSHFPAAALSFEPLSASSLLERAGLLVYSPPWLIPAARMETLWRNELASELGKLRMADRVLLEEGVLFGSWPRAR